MKRPWFVSVDGPKGTGKTTVLEAVTAVLRAEGRKVIRLCERKLDPGRAETMVLVNRMARCPSQALEREICERLADSRAWISNHVLARQPPDSLLLIDRWYPSDAAFRRLVPVADIVQLNLARAVWVPDLHIGLVTAPQVSWARAAARSRGLGSTVISKIEEQVAGTLAFERAADTCGWTVCRNEGPIEEATAHVAAAIQACLLHPSGGAMT
jgi:thymidylate kinase